MKVQAKITQDIEVTAIQLSAGVRYWEDADVNDTEDADGTLIPFRNGDNWEPVIELDTGRVRNWPEGTKADIHYKVCDDGEYKLLNAKGQVVATRAGYVPDILSPGGEGYGDYIIMDIDADGLVKGWYAEIEPEQWAWTAPLPQGE